MSPIQRLEACVTPRSRFLGTAASTIAAAQLTMIGAAGAQRTATAAEIEPKTQATFSALKQIHAGLLDVGYAEAGPAAGPPVILLHGWPYDIHSFVDVAPLLAAQGYRVLVPYVRGCGTTSFLSSATFRNGQQGAVAIDVIAFMDALKIEKAVFGGFDWGGRTADIIAANWPERCKALVSVSGYLISSREANKQPLPPAAEYQWWYQFYFSTERGALGYDKYRHDFGKLIWRIASPHWDFDDATYDRTAAAFENPDYVAIVIHNYRWRIGLADGERQYDELEARLAAAPAVGVPTITMEGDANGAPHAGADAYRGKFSGKYEHRVITGGVGHNLPGEAPQAFAKAIVDVARR
jgi:pimeloyl-ACP methyl ester carboxylesterase